MRLFNRSLLLLCLVVCYAGMLPAAAYAQQAPPVSLEVRAGYDGAGQYRVGHWFPVTIVATNNGADLRGVVEWRFPNDNSGRFRYTIDLPRGARKQLLLPIVTNDTVRSAELHFVAGSTELLRQNVRLNPITSDQFGIGVISNNQTLLNSLIGLQTGNGFGTTVSHIDPGQIPGDANLLAGLDVIFIHDLATGNLSAAQLSAIELWVRMGGQLVVGGGPLVDQTSAGLADLLPVILGALSPDVSTATLGQLARRNDITQAVPTLTANSVNLKPEGRALDAGSLLTSRNLGAGQVVFAAFDLDVLRPWSGEPDLWSRVIHSKDRVLVGYNYRWRNENLLRDVLQLPALSLPSPGLLLLLIVIYILVIGPVNFLLLRRLRRVELAWITTPLLVVVFLGATYGASFVLRGNRPQISQLTIVQGFEKQPKGQATGFVGMFSPQRRSYNLGFASTALVTPGTFEGFQFLGIMIDLDDSSTSLRDLLIDVSALRTLIVEQPEVEIPAVTSELQITQSRISGSVRNDSNMMLRDALIVSGAASLPIGDLAPGANVASIDLNSTLLNFPDQTFITTDGLFNRERVLNSLFGYDRFNVSGPTFNGEKGIPDTEGVYLLAWSDQPGLPISVNGDSNVQRGETLYMIRLDT